MQCGSFNTQHWGKRYLKRKSTGRDIRLKVQRFRCQDCDQTWCHHQPHRRTWSERLIKETIQFFVEGISLRNLARHIQTSAATVHGWIIEAGQKLCNPVEVNERLGLIGNNRWGNVLYLDGKWLSEKLVLLLAVDVKTLDIVAWLICEAETEANYIRLIDLVEDSGYSIRALVTDGGPSVLALTQSKKSTRVRKGTRAFPRPGMNPKPLVQEPRLNVPHQLCVIHAFRRLKILVKRCNQSEELLILINKILFAKKGKQAIRRYQTLIGLLGPTDPKQKAIISFFVVHWKILMTHHWVRINRHRIPRDTNGIENVISYLNTRLKTMRGLKTQKTARSIMSLIVMNFRFKPLENTSNRWKKNKSPIQLAGGK